MASNFINEIAAKFKVLFGRNNMSVCGVIGGKAGKCGESVWKSVVKGGIGCT